MADDKNVDLTTLTLGQLVERFGIKEFVEDVGFSKIVEEFGMSKVLAELTEEQKNELRELLKES